MDEQKVIAQMSNSEYNVQICSQVFPTNKKIEIQGTEQLLIPQNNQTNILNKKSRMNTKKSSRDLQHIMKKNKVKKLVYNFSKKIKINSIYRTPIEDLEDHKGVQSNKIGFKNTFKSILINCGNKKGLSLNNLALILWSLTNIIQTTLMVFVFSIMLVFSQTSSQPTFLYIRIGSFCLYIVDMFLNFTSQRYESGKRLQYIHQIANYYIKSQFVVDLISILIFPLDLLIKSNVSLFISFIYVIKLFSNIKKLQKFQCQVITNTNRQQYYGLIKVFIMNFVIGHFLSILLNLMAYINSEQNWIIAKKLQQSQWFIKYIWGYYWGTNIMLTVGFGDVVATNQYEAFFLIFIQTFSCITLAYNISYVGAIIGLIRQNQQSKRRKLKTFHLMCKQNDLCLQTQSKISNYIRQQYKIKQNYERDTHDQIINSLPKLLQKQYLKQANKMLFDNFGFLNNLTKKILVKLAQEVKRRVCHPQQIILKRGQPSQFYILQKGCVAFVCKIRSKLDGKSIECLQVSKECKESKIFSLDFIKNRSLPYNIKSIDYSIVYYIKKQNLKQVLKNSEMDYQLYCYLKDKDEHFIDQFNLYPCNICQNQFHNKFQCSRLHFMPIKFNVINKYILKTKKYSIGRQKFQRNKFKYSSLKNKKKIQQEQQQYIQQNFDSQHYQYIKKLIEFYKQQQPKKRQIPHVLDNRKSIDINHRKTIIQQYPNIKLQGILDGIKKQNKIWELEQLDIAHDFKYYFKEYNPQALKTIKKNKKFKIY